MEQIDELLQGLRQDATLDSTGQFTVSLQKAIEKVRLLATQEPARWLLYAVQAAVGWQAERVQLLLRPDHYQVSLELELPQPSLSRPDSLLAPGDTAAGSFRAFRNALVWLRALQPQRLELRVSGPDGGYQLSLGNGPPARSEIPASPAQRLELIVDFGDSCQERLAVLNNQVASRLSFCPVPVRLNGVLVNCGTFRELDMEGSLACRYILPAAEDRALLAALHPIEQPALSYLVGDREYERERGGHPAPVVSRLELAGPQLGPLSVGNQKPAGGMLLASWSTPQQEVFLTSDSAPAVLLPAALRPGLLGCRAYFQRVCEAQSTLWIVQRGCRMHAYELLRAQPGWWVALAADSLQTDLSGSKIVHGNDLLACIEWSMGQILNVHDRMRGR